MKLRWLRRVFPIQGVGILWFVRFADFILIDGYPFNEHRKFNKNCEFVCLFQDIDNQSTIQYHGLFMKISSVCYNIIQFLRSNILNLRNLIYFYFHKMLSNKFLGAKIHSLCKICLNEGSNALLLPCHHVSTCHSCTICIEFCPICRCEIKSIKKVYFA